MRTAEGNGPVNALDRALRDAITEIHPHLADIELVNYKVRILDETHGTQATTRVLIDASDGRTSGARSASPRTSSRPRGRRSWIRSSIPSSPGAPARTGPRRRLGPAATPPDARVGSVRRMNSTAPDPSPTAQSPTTDAEACVIGAGASGLAAAKALVDRGIDFDWFEKGSMVGGLWRIDNDNGGAAAYETLHLNSSRPLTQYPSYPMPEDWPDYPSHRLMARYFQDFADKFGLTERITFNTPVEQRRAARRARPPGRPRLVGHDAEGHEDLPVRLRLQRPPQ